MAERVWSYECCATSAAVLNCPTCGGPGEFAGWWPTVEEAMERFRRAYGFEAAGPHVVEVDRALRPLRRSCDRCAGAGVEGDVYAWRECPECEGGGAFWNAPEAAIRSAWRAVARRYPREALPWAQGLYGPVPAPVPASFPARAISPAGGSSRRPRRRRPPKGYSVHGLRMDAVRAAFVEAERRLGIDWKVKGRGHCRRASLHLSYARAVHGVAKSGDSLVPPRRMSSLVVYPVPIIEEAARILGVSPRVLTGTEY